MSTHPFDWKQFHAYRVFDEFLERFILQRKSYVTRHDQPLNLAAAFEDIRIRFVADFNDSAPWPSAADGTGDSLHRLLPAAYGSMAGSWFASTPNPGGPPINDHSDFDGDGIPALLEIALGLNPFSPDADQLPVAVLEGDQLTYSYSKNTSKTGFTYQVETSLDLKQWDPIPDSLFSTEGAIETRKASIPLGGDVQFLRIKISR